MDATTHLASQATDPDEDLADVEYILPLRSDDDHDLADLTQYLHHIARSVGQVTVVDSSAPDRRARHRQMRGDAVRVLDLPSVSALNGKVEAVHRGMRSSSAEYVVIADDDVRWTTAQLHQALRSMQHADLLSPQNVFSPLPWHARWDTARSLLNRAWSHDYPGTLVVRRQAFEDTKGYDGDVLFENLELIRTFEAAGHRVHHARGLFVNRRPPTAVKFCSQRVRQAYDDFAQPLKAFAFLLALPALAVLSVWLSTFAAMSALVAATVGVITAERGRRREGGRAVWPVSSALWAPLWLAERAVCIWLALARRLAGGTPYAGQRLEVAAHSTKSIASRLATEGREGAT